MGFLKCDMMTDRTCRCCLRSVSLVVDDNDCIVLFLPCPPLSESVVCRSRRSLLLDDSYNCIMRLQHCTAQRQWPRRCVLAASVVRSCLATGPRWLRPLDTEHVAICVFALPKSESMARRRRPRCRGGGLAAGGIERLWRKLFVRSHVCVCVFGGGSLFCVSVRDMLCQSINARKGNTSM